MLFYRYLLNCGFSHHEIRVEQSPSGRGSAENWVRKRFVQEVSICRGRHAKTDLIVVIDADTHAVHERLAQLDTALQDAKKPPRRQGERFARLVPKRNVETWTLCLNASMVDEETDYKQPSAEWTELIRSAAKALCAAAMPNSDPPAYYVDSLQIGIKELKQLRS